MSGCLRQSSFNASSQINWRSLSRQFKVCVFFLINLDFEVVWNKVTQHYRPGSWQILLQASCPWDFFKVNICCCSEVSAYICCPLEVQKLAQTHKAVFIFIFYIPQKASMRNCKHFIAFTKRLNWPTSAGAPEGSRVQNNTKCITVDAEQVSNTNRSFSKTSDWYSYNTDKMGLFCKSITAHHVKDSVTLFWTLGVSINVKSLGRRYFIQ